jgi:uncharacterized protein
MKEDSKRGFVVHGVPAKGCLYCVKGEKLVLFITGLCGQKCFYCPVSEQKFGNDATYANEWQIKNKEELVEEVKLTDARGAGITGGDPLVELDKTCEYIKFLKNKFGEKFHIHLYTPFQLVTENSMSKLYEAGLDEIRFHPNIDNNTGWDKIKFANKYAWDVGLEIPCLPNKEKETKKMIDFFADKIKFINLNELECSDTTIKHYNLDEYKTKDDSSYGIENSKETAIEIIKYVEKKHPDVTAYFCSAYLKDKTQMGKRILKRAQNVAKNYDIITEEGMLIRACAYLEELKPGINYRENLSKVNKKEIIIKLEEAKKIIYKKLNIKQIDLDEDKLRLTFSSRKAKGLAEKIKMLGLAVAIVEEYPTKDATEIEIEFL